MGKKNFLKNSLWLYSSQFINLIFPILTLPYISRVLEPEGYGLFAYALTIVIYFQIIVDFGFNYVGTKKIATINLDDKQAVNIVFSTVFWLKLILFVISFIFIVALAFFNIESLDPKILLILSMIPLSTIFNNNWFFQGISKMKFIAITNIALKIFSLILIFLIINSNDDLYLYAFIFGLSYFNTGVIHMVIILKHIKLKLVKISLLELKLSFKENLDVFYTNFLSAFFSGFGILYFGYTLDDSTQLGGYQIVSKIPVIMLSIYLPISQVLFPVFSKKFNLTEPDTIDLRGFKIIFIAVTLLAITIGCIIYYIRTDLINFIFGYMYVEFSFLLLPLLVWFVFSIFNNLLGVQLLISRGYNKEYRNAFVISSISLILFTVIFINLFDLLGIALGALFSEIFLSVLLVFQVGKTIKGKRIIF